MKGKLAALEIFLHGEPIGTLTRFPDDRNLFSFNKDYIDNPDRPTLSLSYKDTYGNVLTETRSTKTRLSPFFSNVLPEGFMRTYLAQRAGVNPDREFYLLAALGHDLPGAITTNNLMDDSSFTSASGIEKQDHITHTGFRFSLTGYQHKFSAIWEQEKKLTIPIDGTGGSWIVKLPSPTFPELPQNEYVMMELARRIGINVPQTALIALEDIQGIPTNLEQFGSHAFAIKRFDRKENGEKVHIEDFAQVFSIYPEKKYTAANYSTIIKVIWTELGSQGLSSFLRRFVFSILIGNGDMHSKNWSLIYPDKKTAQLAPAYDYITTLPYLPSDTMALNFMHNKAYNAITLKHFEKLAQTYGLPKRLILDTVQETVSSFAHAWNTKSTLPLDERIAESIEVHVQKLPLWSLR